MILALALAGLIMLVRDDPVAASIEAVADELERTGAVTCPLRPDEEALAAESKARLDRIEEMFITGYYPDRRSFGCSVITLQVLPTGRVKSIKALRYKGEASLEDKKLYFYFQPSDREWKALLPINSRVAPEYRADAVKTMRERAAKIAQSAAASSSPN